MTTTIDFTHRDRQIERRPYRDEVLQAKHLLHDVITLNNSVTLGNGLTSICYTLNLICDAIVLVDFKLGHTLSLLETAIFAVQHAKAMAIASYKENVPGGGHNKHNFDREFEEALERLTKARTYFHGLYTTMYGPGYNGRW